MEISETTKTRVKTAVLLIVPLIALVLLANYFTWARMTFLAFGCFLCLMSAFEFTNVCVGKQGIVARLVYFLLIAAVPLVTTITLFFFGIETTGLNPTLATAFASQTSFFIACFGAFVYMCITGRDNLLKPQEVARDLIIGLILVGYCGSALVSILALSGGVSILVWHLLVVCLNDSAAYFAGRQFGGTKLAASLSPNKTISGSLGGLVGGAVAGVAFMVFLPVQFNFYQAGLLAATVVICAQVGDLLKSYVKRVHNVKDMGNILPGHGGILDRIDGILFAAPLTYSAVVLLTLLLTSNNI